MDTSQIPFVSSVFHPSDLSEESAHAFAHALAIALRRQTEFTILHVAADGQQGDLWAAFPAVRGTLERWGLLEEGSPRSAVADRLGLKVRKVNMRGDPLSAILGFLDENPTDLIVLATEGRDGVPRWLGRSVAERVSRRSKTMTLFVPKSTRGFVSLDNGSISLSRILVPVDHEPRPETAIGYASRAAGMVEAPVEVVIAYIGDPQRVPVLEFPDVPMVSWRTVAREGDVVEEIVGLTQETAADLIVMATQGRNGILDALRGSVTEQVVRRALCPLLAVPVG